MLLDCLRNVLGYAVPTRDHDDRFRRPSPLRQPDVFETFRNDLWDDPLRHIHGAPAIVRDDPVSDHHLLPRLSRIVAPKDVPTVRDVEFLPRIELNPKMATDRVLLVDLDRPDPRRHIAGVHIDGATEVQFGAHKNVTPTSSSVW